MPYTLSVFCVSAEISQVNEVIHAKKTEVYEKEDAMKGRCAWGRLKAQ
jgi:hypothetical protein